jgi:hypothetical protein
LHHFGASIYASFATAAPLCNLQKRPGAKIHRSWLLCFTENISATDQAGELIMADDKATQADAQPMSAMAAQLKVNLSKTKMMKGAPPDPAAVAAAAEHARALYEGLVKEQEEQRARTFEEQQAASRKTMQMISRMQASMRPELEYLVAAHTLEIATDRKKARQDALRRQREGGQLLPHEQSMLEASALKPEGPQTNALLRRFNRISNAMTIRNLFEQDKVSILSEEKAASEAQYGVPLHVTQKRVENVSDETLVRVIVQQMRP